MAEKNTIKNALAESRIFLGRIVAAFVFMLLLSAGLAVRLAYLQIVGHEHYASLAQDNRIKISPIAPTRGVIYDRRGRVLAENIPTFSLELIPEQIDDLNDTLKRLQVLLNISDETIAQFHQQRRRNRSFTGTPLLLHLSEEDVAKFASARPFYPGVDIYASLVRHYPYGELAAHVVGYVGRINEEELKTLPQEEYRGTHYVGKIGIEKSYEAQLHGHAGYTEIETNAMSRPVNTLREVAPAGGANIYLNLDIDLQKTAYEALDIYNGAVVAIEIESGGVLVLASKPGFDPNPFVYGISRKDYAALQDSPDQPLYNRALRGQYPPGSTFKPFIALAGLEYGVTEFYNRLYCPGYYKLPNSTHQYRDWKKGGHGTVDMRSAITQSCDVYFYDLAMALGIEHMHDFLQQFGFGEKSGIDLIGEKSGLLPSKAWKKARKKQDWYPGETIIAGIGQGYTQATPLQLARATATLANRGKVVTPSLVDRIVSFDATITEKTQEQRTIAIKPMNIDYIISAMIDVVHSGRGTAKRIGYGLPYRIAGKTGTAQVFTVKQKEKYNESQIDFKLRDHALFIAFAPADAPKIAVAVIAENGGHGGSVAAPIAAKVIKQYLQQDAGGE
ncbi:MAG: penicillin-binding protein 2 [Gammaproteobacteria bacterium]